MRGVSLLTPVVMGYDWGSETAIPELLGLPSLGVPQAELWIGAHSAAPSVLSNGVGLDVHLAGVASPGEEPQLPFLMKLLAAESALSIQAHPNRQQAEDGYAREDATGIDPHDPRRNYKDAQPKPEILIAVTPFTALCGLRGAQESAALLRRLGGVVARDPELELLLGLLDSGDLRSSLEWLLSGLPEVRRLAARLAGCAGKGRGNVAETISLVAGQYGDDPGVVIAALMNRVDLQPGQAVFLGAGQLHAYLSGLGIEAMAPSDNVLCGGLTSKHVDVEELKRVVVADAAEPKQEAFSCSAAHRVHTHQD